MIKTLFLSSHGDDYCSAVLAHGLSKLPGVDLVLAQPMNCYDPTQGDNPCNRIVREFHPDFGKPWVPEPSVFHWKLFPGTNSNFDLMVICTAFLREYEWSWAAKFLPRLRPDAKVVMVEGWDAWDEHHEPTVDQFPKIIDVFFRRELKPNPRDIELNTHCLNMAAPPHWFDPSDATKSRHIDVYYAGAVMASPERWDCLSRMFQTPTQWKIVAASCGTGFTTYFEYFRDAKLAVCPVGAAGGFDCMRTWEAVSHGAIPVFCGWPDRIREPWFSPECYFVARTAEELPGVLESALRLDDLEARRAKMLAEAWRDHTTLARAKRMLDIAGIKL